MPNTRVITEIMTKGFVDKGEDGWDRDKERTVIRAKDCPIQKLHGKVLKDYSITDGKMSCAEYEWMPDDGPGLANGSEGIVCKCYNGFTLMSKGLGVICAYGDE